MIWLWVAVSAMEIKPKLGPSDGGTLVYITGEDFLPGPDLKCQIGAVDVLDLTFVRVKTLTGTSPSGSESQTVQCANDGKSFSLLPTTTFLYFSTPSAGKLTPTDGSKLDFHMVTITMDAIPKLATAFCRIADVYVVPATINGLQLTCEYPPFSTLTSLAPKLTSLSVSLSLSFNGQNYFSTSLLFTYLDLMETALNLFTISPYTGPTDGGTIVTVSYPSSPAPITPICRFGSVAVSGSDGSDVSFTCVSPKYEGTAVVPVSISFNGVDFSGAVFLFTYEDIAEFYSITPSQGTKSGGTSVLILGKGFKHYPGLGCYFGTLPGAAVYRDQFHISCVSPPALPGEVALTVTFNGQNSYVAGKFQYRLGETIEKVSPSTGPKSGGTLVEVTAPNYFGGSVGTCRWEGYISEVIVNGSQLFCRSPPYDSIQKSPVLLSISSNGLDFESSQPFTYYDNLKVTSVTPSLITDAAVSRDFTVNVEKADAVQAGKVTQGDTETVVSAVQVSATAVKITLGAVDSLRAGEASISISGNYQDYSYGFPVKVVQSCELLSLRPNFGFLSGGIVLQAFGRFFSDYPPVCLFGSTETPARFLSATLIECVVPLQTQSGSVPVKLSLNGKVDFTNEVLFEYWKQPGVSLSRSSGRNREEVAVTVVTTDARNAVQIRFSQATLYNPQWTGPTTP